LFYKLGKVPQRWSKYYRTSTPAAKPSVESETCIWTSRAAYRGCKPPSISYLQGVSTRKVKAVTEELCGHEFTSATISRMVQTLDEELDKFAQRRLEEPYPYLILDARYEKVREDGTVRSQAVLVAIGINWEGRRNVLAIELASRESASSWKELLLGLRKRSLNGVEFVVSDDHAGLRRAIQEVLPEAVWQRCYVHFLRNALDYLPRRADDDCLMELRWIYDRRNLEEARQDVAAWLAK
jgi:transposase-like protein